MSRRNKFSVIVTIGFAVLLFAQVTHAQSAQPTRMGEVKSEAMREHLDEAEDLLESLLRWKHVVSWSDSGRLVAPPPAGPANTLISIDRADARKLTALVDALVAQAPSPVATSTSARGDLRAHVEKAQQIARELQPPHAAPVSRTGEGAQALLTIDRTALERLEVELDAIQLLLPRATKNNR